jgi:hypothetical protein
MSTTGQLIRAPRRTKAEKTKVPALGASPQKRLYDDAEEAELGSPEGLPRTPHEWL